MTLHIVDVRLTCLINITYLLTYYLLNSFIHSLHLHILHVHVIKYILFKYVKYVNSTVKIWDLCIWQLYERLRNAHPNMTVYKKEDIPERYHLKKHYRVPPLLLEADFGYAIVRVSIYCIQERIRIRMYAYLITEANSHIPRVSKKWAHFYVYDNFGNSGSMFINSERTFRRRWN